MAFIMWNALAKQPNGAQGCDFNNTSLVMGSSGSELTIPKADLVTMLVFVLDAGVQRESGGVTDSLSRARDAIGGAAGASYSGHTASIVVGRGVVLTHSGSGNTFDVGNALAFATSIASLCQSAIPDVSGELMKA